MADIRVAVSGNAAAAVGSADCERPSPINFGSKTFLLPASSVMDDLLRRLCRGLKRLFFGVGGFLCRGALSKFSPAPVSTATAMSDRDAVSVSSVLNTSTASSVFAVRIM